MEDLALIKRTRLQNASRVLLLLVLAIPFALIFLPYATPILMAMFVALGLERILKKLGSGAKRKRYFAAGLFLVLTVFFLLPIFLIAVRVVKAVRVLSSQSIQDSQFFRALFSLWDVVQGYGLRVIDVLGVGPDMVVTRDELFLSANDLIIGKAKILATALPTFGLSLFVFFSFLILFATRGESIKKTIINLNVLPSDEINHIAELLKSSCYFILVSTILIGALQAVIVSLGSLIFGYHEFFLIFAVTFVLSFIPVVGASPVAFLLALISFLNGDIGSGIGMGIVGIVAGTIDNVLKPFIFSGDSKNLHPLVSLFGIIGAILVFGLPGLLLGPLIMQITVELGPPLVRRLLA